MKPSCFILVPGNLALNEIPIRTMFMQNANDNMGIPSDQFVKNKD